MRDESLEVSLLGFSRWIEGVVQKAMQQFAGPQDSGPVLLTEQQAAEMLGVRKHVLRDARQRGELDFVRIGKCIRYEPEMLMRFVEQNKNREWGAL